MAQYYQIQNLDDPKLIYTDVQVVHVASEDQLLLSDDQLMLNDGQQVVYQTSTVPSQQQYQQQTASTTTQYIIGDDITQQQQTQAQHQQVMIHQHQPLDHHQQQQISQQQVSAQQHYVQHEPQQLQQEHHQMTQQPQQQQQLYYTTEQIHQPNTLVQQQQQQQQQQQLHVQQQQYQQQQQIVHQQHPMQSPQQQQQQIVYRMQSQQPQTQQTQMLNNTHVILQQPSGQQVLIQSPQHQDIIMRQTMPQQRIIYNTNRVLYSAPQQQQTQAVLQQSPQSHQQQHIQLQTSSSPMHTPTRLVQTRVATTPQEQQQTSPSHQQAQSNVVFHPIQNVQNSQQLKTQISQQQIQLQQQQQPQHQLVTTSTTVGGGMRANIRAKLPRGGATIGTNPSATHTLIARIPNGPIARAARPVGTQVATSVQQAPRAARPRAAATAGARGRGAARGGRGGALVGAGRGAQITAGVANSIQPLTLQHQQQQTLLQNAAAQGKNITILNPQGQVKHIYRTVVDPQQQLQLVTTTQQTQRPQSMVGAARYRSPPMSAANVQNPHLQPASNPDQSGNNTSGVTGQLDLDLEERIQAVVVKRDTQKPVSAPCIGNPMGATLTTYYDKDEHQLVRTHNGTCITIAEYRKRQQTATGTSSAAIMPIKTPMRAGGPPPGAFNNTVGSNTTKMQPHSTGGLIPVARVAPQPINQQQQQQQQQQPQMAPASAVHRTSHNNYEIHTQHVMQNRNNAQMAEKDRNSAKMLVILVSGEQRLITFTLPRESCTVQDLLEQVGVPFDSSTTIQCVENPGANIDFVVTVGFSVQESASELISRAEQSLQMSRQQENNMAAANAANATTNTAVGQNTTSNTNAAQSVSAVASTTTTGTYNTLTATAAATTSACGSTDMGKDSSITASASSASTANPSKTATEEVPRKIIQGFYAICQSCGFSGYDHAKCERCRRIFIDPPKRVPCVKNLSAMANSNDTIAMSKGINEMGDKKRNTEALIGRGSGKNTVGYGSSAPTTAGRGRGSAPMSRGRTGRSGRRAAEIEPVILTLSSDEEEDDEASNKGLGNIASRSTGATSSHLQSITYEPLVFEPMMADIDEASIYSDFQRDDVTDLTNCTDKLITTLQCKVIRIGTYRFEPLEPVTFTSKGICLLAPVVSDPNEYFPLHIHKCEVVKIIAHFSKDSESMLCFYTLRTCAQYIKSSLQMKDNGLPLDGAAYFSPNGPYQVRKIILQFNSISDQSRNVIKSIWDFFDEISEVDAQDLLQRAADADRQLCNKTNESNTVTTSTQLNPNEIRQLLIYPPGKGGISINTEDYMCLARDQYLNDIIIDFYLKWVHNNVIPIAQREKAFIFSTFFYKRLTTLTRHHNQDKDVKQTAAQKRHSRVQNWTKNVNLFEKDYIIIPINEQSHWFLAIICFPKLKGPVTFDTNVPVEPQQIKKQKGKKVSLQIGNTTITPLTKRENVNNVLAEVCGVGDEDSERDEAEGDESDLASEDSDFDNSSNNAAPAATTVANNSNTANSGSTANNSQMQAIKQPLILIFDSLAGASRSRVVATLRDYLSCEYRAKLQELTPHVFNKDNMPGHCVKVPQQNNFTDCGLYLLQYVEQFFKDPIRDYRLPIKQLSNWFDTLTVTRKREDICLLLQQLMNERNGPNQIILPEIPLPTQNGQLVEPPEGYNIEFEEEDMGEDAGDEDEDNTASTSGAGGDGIANDMEACTGMEESVNTKTSAAKVTTLVPTQGRKIVMKRRMLVSGNNNNSTNNSEVVAANASATQTPGNTRGTMLKIRKVDQ